MCVCVVVMGVGVVGAGSGWEGGYRKEVRRFMKSVLLRNQKKNGHVFLDPPSCVFGVCMSMCASHRTQWLHPHRVEDILTSTAVDFNLVQPEAV